MKHRNGWVQPTCDRRVRPSLLDCAVSASQSLYAPTVRATVYCS
jgi:hypothetical protein